MRGHEVGNTMGVNTWAAFAGSDEQAIVDGDFIMFEREVQPRLKGRSFLTRFADDFVIGCELEADARKIMGV